MARLRILGNVVRNNEKFFLPYRANLIGAFFKFFLTQTYMINEWTPQIEQFGELKEERGHNTEVRFTFVRHSQKASGHVFAEGSKGLSVSSISETGKQRAEAYGKNQLPSHKITKAYATEIDRTRETLISAFEAAKI